ncbi:PREDICTED: ribonuclease H1 [Polistes canadensis]|uniref:ribonuclease H1 n=1 Tax=Polistes canadensis TaxID=91411 RepID=UPI000718E99A|nr:PREDICTED: ribonuclease H1 [Polistes canadensis]
MRIDRVTRHEFVLRTIKLLFLCLQLIKKRYFRFFLYVENIISIRFMKLSVLRFSNYIFEMPMFYYAVARGRKPGIYLSWPECEQQVMKYSGSIFKKFPTQEEAESFICRYSSNASKNGIPIAVECQMEDNCRCSSTLQSQLDRSKAKNSVNIVLPSTSSQSYTDVYTDGACSLNGFKGARAGIGVWFPAPHLKHLNISQPAIGKATNNRAEIQAVTMAARQAKKAGIKKLRICTDSKFLINCITKWMPKWKRNGWLTASKGPVINKEELLEMERELESLQIIWNHVKGHSGVYGNEMADKYARKGLEAYH